MYLGNLKGGFIYDKGILLLWWLFIVALLFHIIKWRAVGI